MATTLLPIPIPVDKKIDPVQKRADEIDVEIFCIGTSLVVKHIEEAFNRCDNIPYVAASIALHKRMIYVPTESSDDVCNYLIRRGIKCLIENKDIPGVNYITHPRKKDNYNIFKTINKEYYTFLYTVHFLNSTNLPIMICKMILDKVYEE
jgi:hypothetical protein